MAQELIKPATFTWVIYNFTKLKTKWLYSDVFVAVGFKWRLLVYPKGTISDDLSLHLQALGTAKLPSNRGIDVKLSLILVNQILEKDPIKKEDKFRFTAEQTYWGFSEFMPLAELHDSGYLVNDTLIIQTNVSVDKKPWESKKEIAAKQIPMVISTNVSVDSSPRYTKKEISALRDSLVWPRAADKHSVSLASSSMSGQSSTTMLEKSKNPPTELSSLKITQKNTPSSATSGTSPPPSPELLQQQRNALKDYLTLSLEDIDQANAFDEIEKITLVLLQHSANSLEITILMDLVSRLAEFKEIVPATKSSLKNVVGQKISISRKKTDVRERSYEQLNSLEFKFSKLSEEEREIEAQIMNLITQKEELLVRKKLTALKLEKINEQVSKDVEEWFDISKEAEQAASNWIEAREKLAQANLSWQLFKQNLELCEKLV